MMPKTMVGQIRGMQARHDKIGKVMHEFKEGALRSSSGQKVANRSQAIAIAMSEAGLSKKRGAKRRRARRKHV